MTGKRVLVVEDQHVLLEALLEALVQMFPTWEFVGVATVDEAERVLARSRFDVLVLDFRVGEHTIETVTALLERLRRTPTVIASGYVTTEEYERLREATEAPITIVKKPFDRWALKRAIDRVTAVTQ